MGAESSMLCVFNGKNFVLRNIVPSIQVERYVIIQGNTLCFKKSFTILKAYINLCRGHVQGFELL
jgi:hypothetical protein